MSSAKHLREFVNERLTAAAEEIFRVLHRNIVEYEEEICRQRKLLDVLLKPKIKLHRIELPQQHVCKEEEVPVEQQLCIQERSSSLDQEDPEPPQMEEEQEELCSSQEGEQLELKQEADTFMLTPTHEESDHSEDHTLDLNGAVKKEPVVTMPVIHSVVSEANMDQQLLSDISHVSESQDQKGGEHGDSGSSRNTEPRSQESLHKGRKHKKKSKVKNSGLVKNHKKTDTSKQSIRCDTCGKEFKCKSYIKVHMRIHTGEKPYSCTTCGKCFTEKKQLTVHMSNHTTEKPYLCTTCGKGFKRREKLKIHIRTHTGEKPYSCETCGKCFIRKDKLTLHTRTHTDEPFRCKTCGKGFKQGRLYLAHVRRMHASEKP